MSNQRPNDQFVLDMPTLVRGQITADQKAKTWGGHNRDLTIGASEVGQCARKVFYQKRGVTPDPEFEQDWGAAERGNAIEFWQVGKLTAALQAQAPWIDLIWARDDGSPNGQQTLVRGSQSATPDGLFVSQDPAKPIFLPVYHDDGSVTYEAAGSCVYFECKSIDPRAYEHLRKAKSAHNLQGVQGMDLVRSLSQHRPDKAVIVYVNASFATQQKQWNIAFDQKIADGLKSRCDDLMFGSYSMDKPPTAEAKFEGGGECDYCPFKRTCIAHECGRVPTDIRPVAPEVEAKLRKLAVARLAAKEAEDTAINARKALDQEVLDLLAQHDTKKVAGAWGYTSAFTKSSPPTLDRAAMTADGIDLTKYEKPGTRYVQVNVSLK